jgi:catalase
VGGGKAHNAHAGLEASADFTASIMYDAVIVPSGRQSIEALKTHGDALHFVSEAFKHGKPVGAIGDGVDLLVAAHLPDITLAGDGETVSDLGVVTDRSGDPQGSVGDRVKEKTGVGHAHSFTARFLEALAEHRHWGRDAKERVPA